MKRIISLILSLVLFLSVVLPHMSAVAGDITKVSEENETLVTEDIVNLEADTTTYVEITQADQEVYCKFVPEESGIYRIYSWSYGGDTDGYLYDSEFQEIAYNDDAIKWWDYDFSILQPLDAGETYYIKVKCLFIEEAPEDIAISIATISEITEMQADVPFEVNMITNHEKVFRFIPEASATYYFSSELIAGYYSIYGELYDSQFNRVGVDESDSSEGFEFFINLTAGEVYYFYTAFKDRSTLWEAVYNVSAHKVVTPATNMFFCERGPIIGYVGMNYWPSVRFQPEGCVQENVILESSDPTVVAINGGMIQYMSAGNATITATSENGLTDSIDVVVNDMMLLELEQKREVYAQNNEEFWFKFAPEEGGSYKFHLESHTGVMTAVLYDSGSHYLEGETGGSDDIKINANLTKGEVYFVCVRYFRSPSTGSVLSSSNVPDISISVRMMTENATALEIAEGNCKGYVGEKYFLHAQFQPEDCILEEVEWESDNPNIVLIGSNGEICFQAIGTAVITATSENGLTDSIEVTVCERPEINVGTDMEYTFISDNEYFKFIPTESGKYIFNAYNESHTPWVEVQDETGNTLAGDIKEVSCELVAGKTYYFRVSAGSVRGYSFHIALMEHPIERIVLLNPPSRDYVWGDLTYGWLTEDGTYQLNPDDVKGLSFVVYFKDGTQKLYSDEDIDDYNCIDGYQLNFDMVVLENIGTYSVVCTYREHEMKYIVNVIESNVSSVEVTQEPTLTTYDNRYSADFTGMKIKIAYQDGTSEIVEITKDNTRYNFYNYIYCAVSVGTNTLNIVGEDGYYLIHYLGKTCNYDGINTYQGKTVVKIDIPNISFEGEEIILSVTYDDQSKENISLDFVDFYCETYSDGTSWLDGYADTGKGFLYFCAESTLNQNEYWVYVLDEEFYLDLPSQEILGDMDGNGVLSSDDAIYLLYHTEDASGYPIEKNADFDKDGYVTSDDAIYLLYHVMMPEKFPI